MIRIGKIVAVHGLQGAVIISHIANNAKWLKKGDVLFLELQKGSQIPFFVEQAKASNDTEYIINLDETNTLEQARKLIGKHVYVKEDVIQKYATNSPLLWIGFKITDKVNGELGIVEDVMEAPAHWLAKVTYKDKEVLLPLVEQMIERIDVKNKKIYMSLPDGLLEVYL